VRALERISADLIARSGIWMMHFCSYFARRIDQKPEVASAMKPLVDELLNELEAHIGDSPFLAGEHVTIADCTLFALFQACRARLGVPIGADQPRLDAWYARFTERPSAAY